MSKQTPFINGVAISIPFLVFLSLLSGIIGGIWLLFNGCWPLVLGGIVFIYLTYRVYPLLNFLMFPALYFAEKGNQVLFMLFTILNILWTFVVLVFLVITVFNVAINFSEDSSLNILPFFLLGFSVATVPFQIMYSTEYSNGVGTLFYLLWIHISYITLVLGYYLNLLWLAIPAIALFALVVVIYLLANAFKSPAW